MANKIMKTLTLGGNTYEIYDETARNNIASVENRMDELEEKSASGILVDTELSETSTNPVQNAVVTAKFSQLQDTIADKATVENGVVKVWKSATEDGGTDTLLYTIDLSSIGELNLENITLSVSQVGEYQRLSMSDGTTTKYVDIPITVISDEQVQTAVETWLNEHPEATTTISDGSIAEKHLASELKNRLDGIEYINKGGKEYEIYPYAEELVADKDIGNFAILNDVSIEKGGLLETVEFPIFTAEGNTQLYILKKTDDTFSVVSKYTVTITGNITDLSALGINVLAGQYLAITNTANFKANILTDDSTVVRYINASNSTNVFSGVYGKTSVKFNILVADNGETVTVKEKVLENEKTVKTFDQRIEENKMLVLESDEVYFYPNTEYIEGETEQDTDNFLCFQLDSVPTAGFLRYIYLPRFIEAFTATIGIVTESDGIYTLIRKHSVEINAKKTDLKEYEIEVNQGEYIGLGLNTACTVGKYVKTGSAVRYMTTDTIGSTLGGQYLNGFALDTNYIIQTGYYGEDVIVKEKVKEIDKRTGKLENNVYQLNNLDNFANVRILHIGTSISDGRTVHSGNYMCTWFKEAMQMLNCSNGVNMANSGKGATYHAENYDTDIAPYIANTDIFTIEHYINDITSMGTKDDLEPDENGNYNITTYQGAMAYIITRARKENPFVKIGLMSHWFNENVATELQEIADKFKLPVLDVGKMLGGHSQQIVDTTMTIRGVEYTGARTISLWYTTSSMYPDGDNLHPFNDKAQTKYAYGYAGWLKSGLI